FDGLQLTDREAIIAERILREIQDRIRFLHDVGVGYLTLGRSAATLSGGEGQRIRLATQIGANLTGVLYVLDEPSIGLHQRDNRKLLATLARLRDLGNTVVVVEHDEETIRTADYVVDLGPGAGEHGGRVIFQGTPRELIEQARAAGDRPPAEHGCSLTGAYLVGARAIPTPKARRPAFKAELVIRGAHATNPGLFTFIRDLFAMMPEAKTRGFRPGRFSFNVKGGRCEACQGDGVIAIEMHFLPDVYVTCEQCKGRRYNHETLQITYRGKS